MILAVAGMSVWGIVSHGWKERYGDTEIGLNAWSDNVGMQNDLCKFADNGTTNNKYAANGCHIGSLNESAMKPSIVLVGDSFTQHLLRPFDTIGKQRNERYRVFFTCSCPFSPRQNESIKHKEGSCTDTHRERWGFLERLKNVTVVIANSWAFQDPREMEWRLVTLQKELRQLGHAMIVIEETPGLHGSEQRRFSCVDLLQQPLLHLWLSLTNLPPRTCIPPRVEPLPQRARNSKWYRAIFNDGLIEADRFVHVFERYCATDGGGVNVCEVFSRRSGEGGAFRSLGYERDRVHLDWEGSGFLMPLLRESMEKQIVPLSRAHTRKAREAAAVRADEGDGEKGAADGGGDVAKGEEGG